MQLRFSLRIFEWSLALFHGLHTFLLQLMICFRRFHDMTYTSSMETQAICSQHDVTVARYRITTTILCVRI